MNPSQKSGNFKPKRKIVKHRKGDGHVKAIARQEITKQLKQKIESKSWDVNNLAFNVDSLCTSSVLDLTAGLVKGTTSSTYIGQAIQPTHLRVRWSIEGNSSDVFNLLRVVVLQVKNTGGVPTGANIFQITGSTNSPLSAYDRSYMNTFRVLYDEFYQTDYVDGPAKIAGDIKITSERLKKILFDETGTLTGGGLYLVMVSDSTAAGHPIGQFYSRLFFKDA